MRDDRSACPCAGDPIVVAFARPRHLDPAGEVCFLLLRFLREEIVGDTPHPDRQCAAREGRAARRPLGARYFQRNVWPSGSLFGSSRGAPPQIRVGSKKSEIDTVINAFCGASLYRRGRAPLRGLVLLAPLNTDQFLIPFYWGTGSASAATAGIRFFQSLQWLPRSRFVPAYAG